MNVLVQIARHFQRWGHFVLLGVGMLVLLGLWLAYPHNYEISDPSQYAYYGYRVSNGSYLETVTNPSIFAHRFGVVVPVGIVYALFGVTPYTTDLVPLLAGFTILFVVWRVLPRQAALAGVLAVITCVPLLRATTTLFPDLIATAFLLLSTLALARRLQPRSARSRQALLAVLGVAAWFCSVLAKESAWWTLPLWAFALAIDVWRKRKTTLLWFHAPALLAGVLFAAAYLAFCGHYFGDPLAHVHAAEALTGKHAWAIHGPEALKTRLTSAAALFFWKQYGLLLVPAALGLLVLPAQLSIWRFYTVTTVLLYWFGSTSLSSYQPLPTMWRMALPCAPGFFICAAYCVHFLASHAPRVLGKTRTLIALSSLMAGLLVPSVRDYATSWRSFPDLEAIARLQEEQRNHPATRYLLISAEKRSHDFAVLAFGYEPPSNLSLEYAGHVTAATLDAADVVLLFVDERHARTARLKDFARPFRALRLPALFKRDNVALFIAEDRTKLRALLPLAH